jgi:hypothetical protein
MAAPPAADPIRALEKLLEVRFHTDRSAWVQRDFVRLTPNSRDPYSGELAEARRASGMRTDTSMAEELEGLADDLDQLVFSLDRASAYFWTDAMTALIIEAAARMPRYTFTESSFPTPEGFVWHESAHDIGSVVPEGELSGDDRVNMFFERRPNGEPIYEPRPLQVWAWRRDAQDGPNSVECLSWRWTGDGPPPHPKEPEWIRHRSFHVRYGETLEDVLARTEGRDWRAFGLIVACALSLMEQTLLVPGRVHVPRALEKRYQHALKSMQEPNLRIVELRKRETLPTSPYAPRDVDWQHRWFVRAHWRQQRHPTTGAYKPVFVHAHMKGPEGKPLLPPRQTIFNVDR